MTGDLSAFDALDDGPVCNIGWFEEPRDKCEASEFERQRMVLARVRRDAPAVFVIGVPNGSRDSDWSRMRKWREGMVAGMVDLVFLWNHGALFAEMKGGTTAIRKTQIEVLNRLHRMGWRCGVYRQPDTLIAHLRDAGAPFL